MIIAKLILLIYTIHILVYGRGSRMNIVIWISIGGAILGALIAIGIQNKKK